MLELSEKYLQSYYSYIMFENWNRDKEDLKRFNSNFRDKNYNSGMKNTLDMINNRTGFREK